MNFGENVRRKRESLHMTQEELADKTDVGSKMISHIETGRKTATVYVAADIAKALGCSLDELTKENCA